MPEAKPAPVPGTGPSDARQVAVAEVGPGEDVDLVLKPRKP